jgi:hypothetical protein
MSDTWVPKPLHVYTVESLPGQVRQVGFLPVEIKAREAVETIETYEDIAYLEVVQYDVDEHMGTDNRKVLARFENPKRIEAAEAARLKMMEQAGFTPKQEDSNEGQ